MMNDVVEERYDPAQWNIYAAQASDGDNWADDSPLCHELLAKKILPMVRYYSYIEITSPCSISANRTISIRYSANCFANRPCE